MATDTRHKHEKAGGAPDIVRRPSAPSHTEPRRWQGDQWNGGSGPFSLMRQMQDEVDRWFGRLGFDRNWTSPSAWMSRAAEQAGEWMPAIDAFQRGNEFVIRADVPGMARTDLSVEIGDDALTIRGERKHEQNDDRDGVYWSERSYGSFSRVVPLPPGAISDSAKATFTNGVLEVVVQSPSQEARRGRKVDISGHDDSPRTKS
jgi:HSP20 family protein